MMKKNLYLLIALIFVSCSSNDDSSMSTNGFKINGKFYATDFAQANDCSPYILIFSSPENHNDGHFARFDLYNGSCTIDTPLTTGTYTLSNGGIYDHHPIQVVDTNSEEHNLAYSIYKNNGIKSGSVTVNSIVSNDKQITEIDLDYHFVWEDKTLVGHYSGEVIPD